MRTVYAVSDNQLDEWKEICNAFAKKINAKVIFVDYTSCGLELSNGTFKHIYIDELKTYLEGESI